MRVNHKILRRGKNNVTFEAHLDSDAGPGTYGYFTFGVSRKMARQMDYAFYRQLELDLDLSRFRAVPSARLSHLAFESDGAFPTQC